MLNIYPKIYNFLLVVVPSAGLILAIAAILFWERQVTPIDLLFFASFYLLTITGITVGYHRLFSHRSFQTTPILKGLIAIAGAMAGQGSLSFWVSYHRRHHLHSDTLGDIHSPHLHQQSGASTLKSFWHAHIGWLLIADREKPYPGVNDLINDPILKTVDQLYPLWIFLSLALPTLLGMLVIGSWEGACRGLIWGGAMRLLMGYQVTFCVNSVCHIWGRQTFVTGDMSRNNVLIGLAALGEGWHNNHHAFPYSAQFGATWWQLDLGWWFILLLEKLGLAWDVKRPALKEREAKMISLL